MSKEPEALQAPDSAAASAITLEPPRQLAILPRQAIVRSRSNPRTHFDAAYIDQLAASIKEHGVLQPILVRPLPYERLQDIFEDREPGAPLPTHEIVCGECRWRATEKAGVHEIPVLIRLLDDIQVLQVQLVENLRRKDLHPLEEAEGFDRLMKDHGMSVEDIAAKVDKSASQIYVTLKLLDLTPECREQLYSGKLTRSTALLVARAPAYLQAEIAKDIMKAGFDGDPMSYRQASRHIHQHYMLQLSTAVFDIKDASLVAKARDCQACPKRTGANSDLFEDVKQADTCTDPKCFDAKKVAHFAQIAKAAAAKGQKVIQGKEAKELIAGEYSSPKGYELLDSNTYVNGRYTTLRKVIGKEGPTPVLIVNPYTKELQEALPTDVANKLIKKAGTQANGQVKNKEPDERELKQQYESTWRANAVREIYAAVITGKGQAFGVGVAREIALYMCHDLYAEEARLVTELLGLGEIGKNSAIETHIKECTPEQVAPALLLLALTKDLQDSYYNGGNSTPFIDALAKDTGVEVAAIQVQVKADMKAAAAARKAEAEATAAPKKPAAPKAAGKKKASTGEAKAGIAQALQQDPQSANDFEVGQLVRFKMDLKGHGGKLRKVSGKEGTVKAKVGDRAWSVAYGSKSHEVATADYTELEPAQDATASGDDAAAAAIGKMLREETAGAAAAAAEPAPNAALQAWPFPIAPKKTRKGAAA